jgi:hypothetical protein
MLRLIENSVPGVARRSMKLKSWGACGISTFLFEDRAMRDGRQSPRYFYWYLSVELRLHPDHLRRHGQGRGFSRQS